MNKVVRGVAVLAVALSAVTSYAQEWPKKPIRLLTGFPAGSPDDFVAKLVQPEAQKTLGQPIVIENKLGAAGNVAAQEVVRAADGYTFLAGPDTVVTINPHLYKRLTFKPMEDLVPVSQLANATLVLVCHPGSNIKSLKDFAAKGKAESMSYASGGSASPTHMSMELLTSALSVKLNHVSYRGPGPAMQSVIAGTEPCGFLPTAVVGPSVKDGKLVAIGVSSLQRSAALPGVPTIAEAGVPGFDATFPVSVFAPKDTPKDVIARLRQALSEAITRPDIRQRLQTADLTPMGNTPAEAASRMRSEFDKWGGVATRIGLQLD